MSKLTTSIKKGAAANGTFISLDVASHIAEHLEEGYVIIPRNELPSVTRSTNESNKYYADGTNVVFTSAENARMWVMRDVAVWQFLEREASVLAAQEAEKDAARDKRRDELAAQFAGGSVPYENAWPSTKSAIDMIIELEAAK